MPNRHRETLDHRLVTRQVLPLVVFFLVVAAVTIGASLTQTVARMSRQIPSAHNELR